MHEELNILNVWCECTSFPKFSVFPVGRNTRLRDNAWGWEHLHNMSYCQKWWNNSEYLFQKQLFQKKVRQYFQTELRSFIALWEHVFQGLDYYYLLKVVPISKLKQKIDLAFEVRNTNFDVWTFESMFRVQRYQKPFGLSQPYSATRNVYSKLHTNLFPYFLEAN